MDDPIIAAQITVAALQNVLFALAVGSLACEVALAVPLDQSHSLSIYRRLAFMRLYSLIALTVTQGVYLWLQAAAMSSLSLIAARSMLAVVIAQSHFGMMWLIALSGAVIAVLGAAELTRFGSMICVSGLCIYAAGRVGASHAADAGDFSMPELVHWLHICSAAWWAGSVILAGLVLRAIAESHHLAFAERLSSSATVALACVVASGTYNATQVTARASAPIMQTAFGHVLAAKLALVVIAASLGAINRLIHLPQLRAAYALTTASPLSRRSDSPYKIAARAFNCTIAFEALTLLLVLVIAAVLGHASPSAA